MANEDLTLTIIGNLTTDPELRWTPAGAAVANFTIAQTPRTFDRTANEWRDGESTFLRCSVWREQAENAAQSLTKGMGVIARGKLKSRSFETKEGERRTLMELEVSVIGPSLERATAVVTKTARNGNTVQGQPGGGFGGQQATGGDPWAQQSGNGWGSQDDSGVPF